jgi:hypothetical protein
MGTEITTTETKLVAAFTEWERRYRAEPERYATEAEKLAESCESYGETCGAYIVQLLAEQNNEEVSG